MILIMNTTNVDTQELARRTQWAYVWTRVLDTPFWGIFNMLPFILYKDLHATPFQLALLVTLKPLVSIFSSYWSASVNNRSDRLKSNILWARIIACAPFFFYPFVDSPWFFIFSFGLYMTLAVGIVPAWMELLKTNVPKVTREKVFSYSQAFGYMGGGLLPFLLGGLLDEYYQAWRWLFPLAAAISLFSYFFQWRILVKPNSTNASDAKQTITHHIMRPWKSAWNVLKGHPDFIRYQIGFMLVGSGLMIMQPALPVFFVDVLNLSYTEYAVAITLCKGLGFVLGSPLWSQWINRTDIFTFSGWIAALACFFPLALLAAPYQILWLYLGYFIYGFMQSGNELSWNMSGPLFSKESDSTPFSSVNVMAVGVRGAIIPSLGGLLISTISSSFTMVLGGILCLFATVRLVTYARDLQLRPGLGKNLF